ncbi:MAG: sigma 54-interacting transcriptional regulator, partial [Treponema sp.]|nr:sigma 54-interacting transcriptional regulator [Treponema sp.]
MKDILFIAPYERMYLSARRITEDSKYRSVEVVRGNLAEGLALAVNAVESHVRVIISRGGTYRLIKQSNIGVPVVEIRPSPFDLIESLSMIMEKEGPLAIIGYSNVINNYDEKFLRKLVKTDLTIINLGENDDVKAVVSSCAERGYTMFLGDTIVKNVCDEAGYDCYLQQSGSSAIQAAMDEALRICAALKQELEQARRLRIVIDFVHDGIIAVDGRGTVILFNAIAHNLLNVKQENILGESIETLSYLPFIRMIKQGEQIVDQTFNLGNRILSVSAIPVSMETDSFGYVVIIRDVQELQAWEQKLRLALSDKGFVARHTFGSIVYKSAEIAHSISIAKKFSRYTAAVLIEGESGVGKELFAQSIHNHGVYRNGPFVAVNCAVLPKSLIESELFGYVEGAFTGSRKGGKAGYFELAHKGTLFLDEISELPLDMQAQLLRVIQEKQVMRLGDVRIIPVEVRLICAANKNLVAMARDGLFRRDLLFRINTLSLYIPPLSKRLEDIDILAAHFLDEFCKTYNKAINGFSPKAAGWLRNHYYEGNVRELRGMVERAVIICEGNMIRLSDLQSGRREEAEGFPAAAVEAFPDALYDLEKEHIRRVLADNRGSMSKTASALGISRSTLWRKIQKIN